ncbi:TPA: hypothetical protein CPT81_00015 [Candidatus Gastranaerophilales bacterium HUM_20]|jgi:hypothetical protein|nr:MAG TPA: hypothetical protein CPT81_00015 [Candidatus Gastranaerophilales bacterium HUM_20]
MFKSQSKYRIKSLILVLTSTNISVIIILQIKKAVAPTKETNRHQSKKKGKPIISQSAKWYKVMRFEVKDDTITSETLGKTDIYKIVKKIPFGFYVWNIGENMGSDEYIPLCQDLYPGIKDDHSINFDTLRAIKLPKEEVELLREAAGWGVNSLETARKVLKSRRHSYMAEKKRESARKTIVIFERITE